MSNEEIKKIKLNCLTDFQRAAILYTQNGSWSIFFNHGQTLLQKLNSNKLLEECNHIQQMIDQKEKIEYVSDRLLTVGLMASC